MEKFMPMQKSNRIAAADNFHGMAPTNRLGKRARPLRKLFSNSNRATPYNCFRTFKSGTKPANGFRSNIGNTLIFFHIVSDDKRLLEFPRSPYHPDING